MAQQNAQPRHRGYSYSSILSRWDASTRDGRDSLTNPEQGNAYNSEAPDWDINAILVRSGIYSRNYAALVCQLYSTSYDVAARFENGVQSMTPGRFAVFKCKNGRAACGVSLSRAKTPPSWPRG